MAPLISVADPVTGPIVAALNAITAIAEAIKAVAQDQSPEGRKTAAALLEWGALPLAIITKLNQALKVE